MKAILKFIATGVIILAGIGLFQSIDTEISDTDSADTDIVLWNGLKEGMIEEEVISATPGATKTPYPLNNPALGLDCTVMLHNYKWLDGTWEGKFYFNDERKFSALILTHDNADRNALQRTLDYLTKLYGKPKKTMTKYDGKPLTTYTFREGKLLATLIYYTTDHSLSIIYADNSLMRERRNQNI